MPLAALISAGASVSDAPAPEGAAVSLRATLYFAGQTLFEYQARQAVAAGADIVVVMVGAVLPALSAAVDRLAEDGISVLLVRDIVSLARQVPQDHDILLLADGAIVDQPLMDDVAGSTGPAVGVVADSGPAAAFERIDGQYRWAGVALLKPEHLFDTLDMLGDWDLQSTLLRRVVQAGGARIVAPSEAVVEGRIAIVESQQAADLLADATIATRIGETVNVGPVERLVLGPVARLAAQSLMRHQVPSYQVDIASAALAAIGLIVVQLDLKGIALMLFLLSVFFTMAAGRLRRAALRDGQSGWLSWLAPGLVLAGIALTGSQAAQLNVNGWMGGVYLALMLGMLGWLSESGRLGTARSWPLCMPGTALLILTVTQLLGLLHIGLAITLLYALASIGWALLDGDGERGF